MHVGLGKAAGIVQSSQRQPSLSWPADESARRARPRLTRGHAAGSAQLNPPLDLDREHDTNEKGVVRPGSDGPLFVAGPFCASLHR